MDYKIIMTILASITLVSTMFSEPTKLSFAMWVIIALMNIWRI